MFIPFVFTMDERPWSKDYAQGDIFYMYADACIAYNWPIIAPERYFSRFSKIEDPLFGMIPMNDFVDYMCMRKIPTAEEILSIKAYSIPQAREDSIIDKYPSKAECLNDLLTNENAEFEQLVGELLDKIIEDSWEKPEGILCFEILPKFLVTAAEKRNIPVIYQLNGLLRKPLYTLRQHPRASFVNCLSLKSDFTFNNVQEIYERFLSKKTDLPMLSRKGIMRLFVAEQYIIDIHNMDKEPEYDVGILYNNFPNEIHLFGQKAMPDQEMSLRTTPSYEKVLVRMRPGFEQYAELEPVDDSPTCFHFCCKCKHVLGSMTKGMFEVMLAGRIAHEYGHFLFRFFCNDGIEDDSKGVAPLEFINFVVFLLWAPFTLLTDPDHLRLSISECSEKDLYMRNYNFFTRDISKEDIELYYTTSGREYRIGDPLYFSSGHLPHQYASYYCKRGLYIPEATHTWSEGEITEFEFDLVELPAEDLIITVALHSFMCDSTQIDSLLVRCEVNGHVCGEARLSYSNRYLQFVIPNKWVASKLSVAFIYDNPQVILVGEEQKRFALAFEAIRVSADIQSPFENALLLEGKMEQANYNALQTQRDKLEEYCEILKGEQVRLEECCEAFKSEQVRLEECCEAFKSDLDRREEDCQALLRENNARAEELAAILESKVYRHIAKPIWRTAARLKGRRT